MRSFYRANLNRNLFCFFFYEKSKENIHSRRKHRNAIDACCNGSIQHFLASYFTWTQNYLWFSHLTTKIRHVSTACEQNYCLFALLLFGTNFLVEMPNVRRTWNDEHLNSIQLNWKRIACTSRGSSPTFFPRHSKFIAKLIGCECSLGLDWVRVLRKWSLFDDWKFCRWIRFGWHTGCGRVSAVDRWNQIADACLSAFCVRPSLYSNSIFTHWLVISVRCEQQWKWFRFSCGKLFGCGCGKLIWIEK